MFFLFELSKKEKTLSENDGKLSEPSLKRHKVYQPCIDTFKQNFQTEKDGYHSRTSQNRHQQSIDQPQIH